MYSNQNMVQNLYNESTANFNKLPLTSSNIIESKEKLPSITVINNLPNNVENVEIEEENNPYKWHIIIPLMSINLLYFSLQYYEDHKVIKFNPEEYLEPCNATIIWPLNVTLLYKEQMNFIEKEINETYKAYYPGMPIYYQDYLMFKRINLTTVLDEIIPQYYPQRNLRLKCFKENLWSLACGQFDPVINLHFAIALLLLSISIQYIIKARIKHSVSAKEILLTVSHFSFSLAFSLQFLVDLIKYYMGKCEAGERYIEKFPL